MEKGIKETLDGYVVQLEGCKAAFLHAFAIIIGEEKRINDTEIINACKSIIRKQLDRIKEALEQYKETIGWSMLDERSEVWGEMKSFLYSPLITYKDYEEEQWRTIINQTLQLLGEGAGGFRQGFITETYYEDLLRKERERYKEENYDRLENIYKQDFADDAFNFPDETNRKNHMVSNCRNELFSTRFGTIYHDQGRNGKQIAVYIVEQKEQNYKDIHDFFGKWLALEIAKEHCLERHEQVYQNYIFKDNVDVDKVMGKLADFVRDGVITAQKHWFIAYKVFKKKCWLKNKGKQVTFREQINAAFGQTLRCTDDDFRKVHRYFKNTDYADWSLDSPRAPMGCESYKRIADALDNEFTESQYAKPGTLINTPRHVRFR